MLVLRCSDIDKTRAFYEKLGMRFERERHGTGAEHFACADGDVTIELYPSRDPSAKGVERLGFTVHSLDQAVAAVREAGALVRSAPTLTEAGPRAVVEDPDGRAVELEQGW